MKKTLILLFFSASLSAGTWNTQDYTIQSSQKDGDVTTDVLLDKTGTMVTVSYSGDLKETYTQTVKKMDEDFHSWNALKVDSIKFSFANEEIEIYVTPKSYMYNNVNMMDYLPSGILFSYRAELVYNFRIMVNKLFVPIKGIFFDEKTFNEKILSAIKDPTTYINARDPEYLLEKLERMSVDFERLRAAYLASMNFNRLVDKNAIQAVIDLKSKNPSYTFKEVYDAIREKKIDIGPGVVKDILRVYYNEY